MSTDVQKDRLDEAIQELKELREKHRANGLAIVSVIASIDDNRMAVGANVDAKNAHFLLNYALNNNDWDHKE